MLTNHNTPLARLPAKFILPVRTAKQLAKMSGFDERPVYFSDAFGSEEHTDEREVNRINARKRFREFIREFHEGTFRYPYR